MIKKHESIKVIIKNVKNHILINNHNIGGNSIIVNLLPNNKFK